MRNPFKRNKQKKASDPKRLDNREKVTDAAVVPSEVETTEGKLLVVGRESTFSDEVIDYAIDMAQRMSFEIVALNAAPLSCDSFRLFSTSQSKICREFQSISEENAAAFRQAAETRGISFSHVVKFDDPELALASIQKEVGNIEFVISEAQQPTVENRAAESNRPQSQVVVYSMI
jgi:hypothetical protein